MLVATLDQGCILTEAPFMILASGPIMPSLILMKTIDHLLLFLINPSLDLSIPYHLLMVLSTQLAMGQCSLPCLLPKEGMKVVAPRVVVEVGGVGEMVRLDLPSKVANYCLKYLYMYVIL